LRCSCKFICSHSNEAIAVTIKARSTGGKRAVTWCLCCVTP
jgi:hypothetical protein